jgi:hypothetical protein
MTKKTIQRTDPHCPTRLAPVDYEFIGMAYWGSDDDFAEAVNEPHVFKAYESQKWEGQSDCRCAHCGVSFAYGAIFKHRPTGDHIAVGHTCASKAFDSISTAIDFQAKRLKKRVADRRKSMKIREKAEAQVDATPGLREAFKVGHHIISDIESKLYCYGSISLRQVDLVLKIADDQRRRDEERKEEVANAGPMPTGRVEIEGVIVHTRWQESNFSYYGGCTKMIVKLDDGNKVWGTMPSALEADKGDRVRFTATVEVSDKDEHFGFFKRPVKAEVVLAA